MKIRYEKLEKMLESFRDEILLGVDDKLRYATDLVRQEIHASEHRVKIELRDEFRRYLSKSQNFILTGLAEFLDTRILPQTDNQETRITKLEPNWRNVLWYNGSDLCVSYRP